jgi:hypothetical protein
MSKQRYRKISVKIWGDQTFQSMPDNGKLAWLFLLTHPQMTSIGAMRGTIPGLAAELGWPEPVFRKALTIPLSKGMVKLDERMALVVVPKFIHHNPPENPNVVKSWDSILDTLPECQLLFEHLEYLKEFVKEYSKGLPKPLPIPFRKGMPIPEPEPEPEQEQEQDNVCAEPPGPTPDDDPVVMTFDCVGGSWPLRQSKIEQWRDTFGEHCDVEFEIRKAHQWLRDNPTRRKTPQGMTRFLGDWIQRTVNRGHGSQHTKSSSTPSDDLARLRRGEIILT